jgi:hypothetical protein
VLTSAPSGWVIADDAAEEEMGNFPILYFIYTYVHTHTHTHTHTPFYVVLEPYARNWKEQSPLRRAAGVLRVRGRLFSQYLLSFETCYGSIHSNKYINMK